MPDPVHFLVRLVALAGDQHDVAGAGRTERTLDGGAAVALDHDGMRAGKPRQDVRHDRVAILGARVVVGHEDDIGQALGDFRHFGPLALVALSAAAEDAPQPRAGMAAQRRQRLLQRVGRVRIVDHDQRVPPVAAEPVHAPGHRFECAEHHGDVRGRVA